MWNSEGDGQFSRNVPYSDYVYYLPWFPLEDKVYSLLALDHDRYILENGGIVKINLHWTGYSAIETRKGGRNDKVTSPVLLSDGYTVLSGSLDSTLKLWDSRDSSCLATMQTEDEYIHYFINCLTLLPPPPSSSSSSSDHQLAVSGSA
jgi:WD40 repeat protein